MAETDTAKILAAIGKLEAQVDGLRHDVDGLRRELHQEVNGLRRELHTEVDGLRQEMRAMEARLSGDAARQLAATWSVNLVVSRPNGRSPLNIGTGCIVSVDCGVYCLTAAHVVAGILEYFNGDEQCRLEVKAFDGGFVRVPHSELRKSLITAEYIQSGFRDIGLIPLPILKADSAGFQVASPSKRGYTAGTRLFASGPIGVEGPLCSHYQRGRVLIGALCAPGCSGAPLFDFDGKLVAVLHGPDGVGDAVKRRRHIGADPTFVPSDVSSVVYAEHVWCTTPPQVETYVCCDAIARDLVAIEFVSESVRSTLTDPNRLDADATVPLSEEEKSKVYAEFQQWCQTLEPETFAFFTQRRAGQRLCGSVSLLKQVMIERSMSNGRHLDLSAAKVIRPATVIPFLR